MYLGIKVGPDNWREKLLDGPRVRHVEVYHDFDMPDDDRPLYAWLRAHGVRARLHASTSLPGGVVPTLGTHDAAVRGASVALFKRTFDVAAENGLDGVVVHAGAYRVFRIRRGRIELIGPETPAEEGQRWLREALAELAEYGRARGVEPLIENMPGYELASYAPRDRSHGVEVGFVRYPALCELGQAGFSLCLDLAHLYSEWMVTAPPIPGGQPTPARRGLAESRVRGSNGRERADDLHKRVREAAAQLAPYTRHVHLSTIVPPWNGTDGHSGFLPGDYGQGAIPNRKQLLSLLEPFVQTGVWLIPEPHGGPDVHRANYRRLASWLRTRLNAHPVEPEAVREREVEVRPC